MTKFIGRQFDIGIGRETTRGTAVAASYWMPDSSLTIDDMVKQAINDTSIGVIEEGVGADMTSRSASATLDGRITDISFGLILKTLLGTETKSTVTTGVDAHKFTMLQSAQHPTVSISVYEPNAGSGQVYPLGALDSLDLTFELNKYATYKAVYKSNVSASQSNTAAYTTENPFRPQDMTFNFAPTYTGLTGALTATGTAATTTAVTALSISTTLIQVGMTVTGTNVPVGATVAAIVSASAFTLSVATTGNMSSITFGPATVPLKSVSLAFKKNTEDDQVLGAVDPIDRLNKAFSCTGSFELYYTDRTWIDTVLLGDNYEAMQFVLANTAVTIGSTYYPTVTINLARTKLESVARKVDNKGIVSQTIKFKAYFSLTDSEMLDITLQNTNVSTY